MSTLSSAFTYTVSPMRRLEYRTLDVSESLEPSMFEDTATLPLAFTAITSPLALFRITSPSWQSIFISPSIFPFSSMFPEELLMSKLIRSGVVISKTSPVTEVTSKVSVFSSNVAMKLLVALGVTNSDHSEEITTGMFEWTRTFTTLPYCLSRTVEEYGRLFKTRFNFLRFVAKGKAALARLTLLAVALEVDAGPKVVNKDRSPPLKQTFIFSVFTYHTGNYFKKCFFTRAVNDAAFMLLLRCVMVWLDIDSIYSDPLY
mmetsp:Transcript_8784/g.10054  ORF Transcript_8784/g.10054 Transcript_8784/m.10054 type:complete len:259 (+) Transcript_8784:826-1602(+)